ncbi:MAG: hypothetical protein D6731_08875 [Planctomycetota bacterium]|nr:MAG: hypothetical protein D6731_08875 [Planctomycetota bacterium]
MPFWEIEGASWRAAEHAGTLPTPRGLSLVGGVSRGSCGLTLPARGRFARAVVSLEADPWPPGSGARLLFRVRRAEEWSAWRPLAIYGEASEFPRSEEAPEVEDDLIALEESAEQFGLRVEVERGSGGGAPLLRRVAVDAWPSPPPVEESAPLREAWGRSLSVPPRSQRVEEASLRDVVCAPTSLGMVLAYHGDEVPTATLAAWVRDRRRGIYGNWSFNVAVAAERGLRATVRRFASLRPLEEEIRAGRPVVVSHRFAAGALRGSPLPGTEGHLLVVAGFTAAGDVVVADPAAPPAEQERPGPRSGDEPGVLRVYEREAFRRSWLDGRPSGIAWTLGPRGPV